MGAWGVGMRANDEALDAIGAAGLSKADPRKCARTTKLLREGKRDILSLFTRSGRFEPGWIIKYPHGILGLADTLLDEGFDLSPVRKLVHGALKKELRKSALETWTDPEERKAALLRFRDRLDGKIVDEEALATDNEGLFVKMAKYVHQREFERRKRWKPEKKE